jgi:hypothetical protein
MNNLNPGDLVYLPPDYGSMSGGYRQALDNAAQRALYSAYQPGSYNPLTSDIDRKLLAVWFKQNQAKHKIQDMMLFTKRLE